MAIYSLPTGPFNYSFGPTFARLPKIPIYTGGQFDYTYESPFSIRQSFQGSIGGSTFQVSSRNFSIRHHNVPTVKRSVAKQTGLQNFKDNISRYQATSQSERNTWEAQKVLYPRVRSNGTLRIPNRYNLFISSNQNLSYSLGDNIATIGSFVQLPFGNLLTFEIDYNLEIAVPVFNINIVPAGFNYQFFSSRPVGASEGSFARAALRLIRLYDELESLSQNIFTDYVSVWQQGAKPVGSIVFAAVFPIPLTTGQKSPAMTTIGELV